MMLRAGIVLLPLVAFAQTAPPEVDQALRARAAEFLQDHVEGNFRKAYDLVAEDSKDFYFAAQKTKYNWFKIDEITYSDDFTKAGVKITAEYNVTIQTHILPVVNSTILRWQIEDGKWVWHYDPKSIMDTPMGWSDMNAAKANAQKAPPPKLTDEALAQRAHEILTQSGVDKSEVTLAADKASSDQVVFHNALPGSVQVTLDPVKKLAGFRAEVDKSEVGANGNAVLKLSYDPSADSSGEAAGAFLHLQLRIEPFDRVYPVEVRFSSANKDSNRQP